MKTDVYINPPEYDPNLLLDALSEKFRLKNDAGLARFLEIHPAAVSKLRRRRMQMSANLMISFHEATGLGLRELRALMGDTRRYALISKNSLL